MAMFVGLTAGRRLVLAIVALLALWPSYAPLRAQVSAEALMERDDAVLRESMLAAHNIERRARGVPPLAWSAELAAHAALSAYRLSAEPDPVAAHGKGGGDGRHGENLWAGTRDAFAYTEMTKSWLEERALYVDRPMPDVSRSGNWADVGHYSQIIWSTTRHVGCALVANLELDLLVCRYDPPGNILGRSALTDLAAR